MSTNAASWFYHEPEHVPYLISERLNATFWQARIVGIYWRCVQAEPPFRAEGYASNQMLELEWQPAQWLALKVPTEAVENGMPDGAKVDDLVDNLSKRILAKPASLSYVDPQGRKVYEWHIDGGAHRWSEIQGKPGFSQPKRFSK